MKGFIKIHVMGNPTSALLNIQTISLVWSPDPGKSQSKISLTTIANEKSDVLLVSESVAVIEGLINRAQQEV